MTMRWDGYEYQGKHRGPFRESWKQGAPVSYSGRHRHMFSRGVKGVCLRCWVRVW